MTTTAANITPDYSWVPPAPPRTYRLYPGEKLVFQAREHKTAAPWAQGNRYVAVSAMPGYYDGDVTPYAKGILEAFSAEWVREIFLAGGSQSAKSDILHTLYGWTVENWPGPSIFGMQDRETCRETVRDRVVTMLKNTPSLRKYITKNPDDITGSIVRTRTSILYLAWAGSEGRLASKPICNGFIDEVDLWEETAILAIRARFRTYEAMLMSKIVEACTVSTEDGRIWSAQHEASARWDFYAICPHCGHSQTMSFSGVRWGDDIVDPADLSGRGSAWYACESCQDPWDEDDRNMAVLSGSLVHDPPFSWHGWRTRVGTLKQHLLHPEKIWFHIPPMLSRFVFFHTVAAAYLRQLIQPTAANVKYFYNDCCALPVPKIADSIEIKETELHKRREHYGPADATWQVPMQACVITGDSDVQQNRIEAEIVAWGPGHESWGLGYKVFHGDTSQDDVWDALHEWVQTARYTHESGAEMRIVRFGIDLGYAGRKVAKFVKRDRNCYRAHKGSNDVTAPFIPHRPSKSKYGIPFYSLGVSEGKDDLFSWLTAGQERDGQFIPIGPRACHWNMEYDFEYFRMLCAEAPKWEKDSKTGELVKRWYVREGYLRNESLDTRVGNMAIREILNPNYKALAAALIGQPLRQPEPEQKKPESRKRAANSQQQNLAAGLPGWFRNRG